MGPRVVIQFMGVGSVPGGQTWPTAESGQKQVLEQKEAPGTPKAKLPIFQMVEEAQSGTGWTRVIRGSRSGATLASGSQMPNPMFLTLTEVTAHSTHSNIYISLNERALCRPSTGCPLTAGKQQ